MSGLATFFEHAQGFLLGREPVEALERVVGPSASGSESLAFYAVLVRRNLFKIMRDVFPSVLALIRREHAGLWTTLIDDYAREHPPRGWDPNGFGEHFSAFLARRREHDPRITALHEELADFHWLEFLAWSARDELPPEGGRDGLNHRLFVRQYSRRVPDLAHALRRDPASEVPPERPTPTLVYRDPNTHQVRVFYPTVIALAVLSQRRGGQPRAALLAAVPGLTEELLDKVERELSERGIVLDGAP